MDSRVTQSNSRPPTKPKPANLSAALNKKSSFDAETDSSRSSSNHLTVKKVSTTKGPNVNRLSSVFENASNIGVARANGANGANRGTAQKKQTGIELEKGNGVKNGNIKKEASKPKGSENVDIDDSALNFSDIKARFQKEKNLDERKNALPNKKPYVPSRADTSRLATPPSTSSSASKTGKVELAGHKKPVVQKFPPPPNQFSYESDADDSTSDDMVIVEASRKNHKQANGVPIVKLSSKETVKNQSSPSKIRGRGSSTDYSSTSEKDDAILSIDDFAATRQSIAEQLHGTFTSSTTYTSYINPPSRSSSKSSSISYSRRSVTPPSHPTYASSSSTIAQLDTPTSEYCSSLDDTFVTQEDLGLEKEIDLEFEKETKRRKQLWNVIRELVETEGLFLNDMYLLKEVYYIQARDIPIFNPYDLKVVFGNLTDIIDFSDTFYELLQAATGNDDLEDTESHLLEENDGTWIGEAFVKMLDSKEDLSGNYNRMEATYGEYCKRHESAVAKLQELENNEIVQGFLQKCQEQCEGRTRSWDIASLLIKPVQRVLKYPLLLQQILQLTKPSHPDYGQLKHAFDEMQKVAERINDIKRRKDIVEKIVGSKKRNDGDIVRGFTKTLTRRKQILRHMTGLAKPTEDELYIAYVDKFKHWEQQGVLLQKNVKDWVKSVKQYFEDQNRIASTIEDFYVMGLPGNKRPEQLKRMAEYRRIIKELPSSCGKEMEEAIKKYIYPKLETFMDRFKAPTAVMKKREKKVLDYERAESIKEKGDTPDKALQESADAFTSISQQLHEELPKFFEFMRQFFNIIVEDFARIQAQFYRQMGMEFRQYFYKYIEQEALEYVSNDRELVIREFDVVTEYGDKMLEIESRLSMFVLCNQSNGSPIEDTDDRGRKMKRKPSHSDTLTSQASVNSRKRSVSTDPKRRGGMVGPDRTSWRSSSSTKFGLDKINDEVINPFDDDMQYGHRKYATDGAVPLNRTLSYPTSASTTSYTDLPPYTETIVSNITSSDDDDDIFHDTLTGEEGPTSTELRVPFLVATLYRYKTKEKNMLSFEAHTLLKVIHIDEKGEWWFAVNEDTGERGWVDVALTEKLS